VKTFHVASECIIAVDFFLIPMLASWPRFFQPLKSHSVASSVYFKVEDLKKLNFCFSRLIASSSPMKSLKDQNAQMDWEDYYDHDAVS